MSNTPGSLVRHAAAAACLIFAAAHSATAQLPAPAPTSPQFLPRYQVHLSAAGLSSDDPRFSWDTHWGGDFDIVDYVRGRITLLADYEAVLGREYRLFDPTQGNYTLAMAGSFRYRGTEFTGVLHHISRHLSDRPKRPAVAMNALELRLMRQLNVGPGTLDLRLEGGPVIARAFVDYDAMGVGEATMRQPLTPHVAVFGRAREDYFGVKKSIYGRSAQNGGRVEAGVRFSGAGGALELFGGYERIIDAYQLDLLPQRWAFAGFRLVN
jgi:hypothetical protein